MCVYFIKLSFVQLVLVFIASTIASVCVFTNLKVSTLITLFKEESSAQSIFALIFERICRDTNDKNAKILDELYELLRQFDTNDRNEQKILLEIAVLVVGDLSKDKKNRIQCDRFREILFEIIKNVAKDVDNGEWLIGATLPAFVIIVKAYITANKSDPTQETNVDEPTIQLIKMFLKNSVRFPFVITPCKYLSEKVLRIEKKKSQVCLLFMDSNLKRFLSYKVNHFTWHIILYVFDLIRF